MKKSKILIVVKTYPEISSKYTETVCTAGISADTKKLMRLYPIRFRYLEGSQQFKKYQWIRANIRKTSADPRPESYNNAFIQLKGNNMFNFQTISVEFFDFLCYHFAVTFLRITFKAEQGNIIPIIYE